MAPIVTIRCAGVSASDDVVEFESVLFYCSQCLSTDTIGNRLVALKTQPNVTTVMAKQAQSRKRQFNVHSVIGPFTSLV